MNNTKQINNPETQTRIQNNIVALKALKQGRTDELHYYSGWGGLRDAIYDKSIFCQLKFDCGLTDAEINSIKTTLTSAYFTPPELITGMWRLLQRYVVNRPITLLEPSVGTGEILAAMPETWQSAAIDAIELDTLSAQMTKARFTFANVQCMDFAHFSCDTRYQVIIGNPPFGKNRFTDTMHTDLNPYRIHHQFLAKAIRLLEYGGFLLLVLPSYALDNQTGHVRDIVARDGGELVEAWRFPCNLFANARVTIDVCLFTRRKNLINTDWTKTDKVTIDGHTDAINHYFRENPKRVLGEIKAIPMHNRMGFSCEPTANIDPIATWYEQLGANTIEPAIIIPDEKPIAATIQTTTPPGERYSKIERALAIIDAKIAALKEKRKRIEYLQAEYAASMRALDDILKMDK